MLLAGVGRYLSKASGKGTLQVFAKCPSPPQRLQVVGPRRAAEGLLRAFVVVFLAVAAAAFLSITLLATFAIAASGVCRSSVEPKLGALHLGCQAPSLVSASVSASAPASASEACCSRTAAPGP